MRSLLLVAALAGAATLPAPPRRDVLLITIDTWRADAAGFTGSRKVATPVLDRLATGGRVFTDTHAHAVITLPSHASMLTGLLPFEHGVRDNAGFTLRRDAPTLATILAEAGYATAAFVSSFPLDSRFGLDRGFGTYDDAYEGYHSRLSTFAERPGSVTIERAKRWWDASRGRPRFLWVHLFEPHFPYEPGEPYKTAYADRPYYGEIALADRQLAALIDPLVGGADPGTLVVVTGDHGEALGEHGERTHGIFAYEGTLKVPLIVFCPGRVKPGRESAPAWHVDLLPTILDAVGLPPPKGLPGRSLLVPAKPGGEDRRAYFEAMTAFYNRGWAPLTGTIDRGRKAIALPLPELYDLAKDPGEATNLAVASGEAYRAVAGRIPAASAVATPREEPDSETIERLRSLGYVSGGSVPPPSALDASVDPKRLIGIDVEVEDALAAHRKGDAAGAIRRLEAILAANPRMAYVYSQLAFIYADMGRPGEAVSVLSRAVTAGLGGETLKIRLARGLLETGRAREGLDLAAAFRASKDPETQDVLGGLYAATGNAAEAEARYRAALAADPEFGPARVNLAVLAIQQGRLAEAKPLVEAALARNPQFPDAWNALGVIRAGEKDLPGAIDAWERAVRANPRLPVALFNLAAAYRQIGDNGRAIAMLERVLPLVQGESRRKAEAALQELGARPR